MEIAILPFGPQLYGGTIITDYDFSKPSLVWGFPTTIDVETDEKDNFVTLAITQDGYKIYCFNRFTDGLKDLLEKVLLIGHNVKFDLKLLIKWGAKIKPEQLYFDTCLASYVVNTTKESHHLKDLGKEILEMSWPTYREMVGSGRKKETLDKQPVDK